MFCEDENPLKLPTVPAPAKRASTPTFMSPAGRTRVSIGPGYLPPLSGLAFPRIDGSRAHRSNVHRPTHVPYRSQAESISISSSTQRYNTYDAKRYLTLALNKSAAAKEKFFEQLLTYKTFAPLVAENEAYGGKQTPTSRSAVRWDDVDRAVRTSHALADRRGADGPFLATVKSAISPSKASAGDAGPPGDAPGPGASSPPEPPTAADLPARAEEALLAAWRRAHPAAPAEALRQERRFRDEQRRRHERLARGRHRRAGGAAAEEALDAEEAPGPAAAPQSRARRPAPDAAAAARAEEAQARAWETFLAAAACAPPRRADVTTRGGEAAELRAWLSGGWRVHTHRHETAAVRIQCAYRCYGAARAAAQRRYSARLAFVELQRAEEEPAHTWAAAQRASVDSEQCDSLHNLPLRALRFVGAKFEAVALQRREAIRRQNAVENYAAVTIQRVFRGHCGRVEAAMERCPELRAARRLHRMSRSVIVLQRMFRGMYARLACRRADSAARVIQRAVRSAKARAARVRLRAAAIAEMQCATRRHAAEIIARALATFLHWRRTFLRPRLGELCVLQRVGRGLLERRHVERNAQRTNAAQLQLEMNTERERVTRATETVQSVWRRYQRREKRHAKWKETLRTEAAEVILRFFRTAQAEKMKKKRKRLMHSVIET